MDDIQRIFAELTPAQAEVISSAVTLFSALIVAVIAPITFHLITRGGLKDFHRAITDLQTAAESARTQAETIRASMGTVREVSTQVGDLGVLIASVQEALANTQNTLLENRTEAGGENGFAHSAARDRIKTIWRGLQEMVERMAARPKLNGNTRARYARVDRRGYLKLISAMLEDNNLLGNFDDWRAAYALSQSAQRAAAEPTAIDLERMEQLARRLLDSNSSGHPAETTPPSPHPGLSPGVLMTPTNVEAPSARDQLRAGLERSRQAPEGEHPQF